MLYLKAILTLGLSFNVHAQAGFQFNRVPVGPDSDFLHPALDQNFIKLCQVGGLAADEILKLRNAANLLVPRDGVNGGLLLQLPKPEYLIGNFVVGSLLLAFFKRSCCSASSFSSMASVEAVADARMTVAIFLAS